MIIVGIGIDICKNSRIENLINRFGNNFLKKIFHEDEIQLGLDKYKNNLYMLTNFFAKRFAAKEALIKAIGFSGKIEKNEIAILTNIFGKPEIKIFGETKKYIEKKLSSTIKFHISLSDEKEFSIANVIIETYH